MTQKPPSCSLRLGERAVGDDRLAVPSVLTTVAISGGCESAAEDPRAGGLSSALKASTCSKAFCISSGAGGGVVGAVVHGEHVLGHGNDPFGLWEGCQSERRDASAGMTIAAAIRCDATRASFVADDAFAVTSGMIDSAVSVTVVITNVRQRPAGPAGEHDREDGADEGADQGELAEAEHRDRLAADLQ